MPSRPAGAVDDDEDDGLAVAPQVLGAFAKRPGQSPSSSRTRLPIATVRPSTYPSRPCPVSDWNDSAA